MTKKQRALSGTAMKDIARLLLDKVDPSLIGVGAGHISDFLSKVGSSAPRAVGDDGTPLVRWQDKVIEDELPSGASVLDLGCGTGELLAGLRSRKGARVQGVELDSEAVFECVRKRVPVFQANLDEGLKGFPAGSFDYVILEETLQTLRRPAEVLREMLRVGRRGIVSFPNFAYWRVRLDLGLRGRMPVTEWLPHRWFDTPNIHLFTLQDFLDWAADEEVSIVNGKVMSEGHIRQLEPDDNIRAEEALLVLERR